MCGGDKDAVEIAKPYLECYSRSVQHNGGPGKGQHTKMANQIVLAGNMAGMAEGLLYASKMGLDIRQTIETISSGAASSTALSVMGKRVADGNFDPGFYIEHYVKDMEIVLEEAARVNLSLPCLSLVKQLYVALKAQGHEKLGTQALVKVL
jgi:3-hydroxyisobutyrate dehydrogenase